ncbi:MAG: carboxy terminal-processing peptidase [Planctomycetota bacterium]
MSPSNASRSPLRALLIAAAAAASLLPAGPADARPDKPTAQGRNITLAVRYLLEGQHLTQQRIDDVISERCLDAYLKALDPWKLYFYQSDIDEFKQNRFVLDDLIKRGDIKFAYTVFDRFLARVNERVGTAVAQIDAPHDFTVDEQMIRDRDDTTYPRTAEEAAERWRKRVKFDLLVKKADEEADDEAKRKLRKRYTGIQKRWQQTTDDDLLEIYLTAMTSGFDPHSTYMSPSTLENFRISFQLELDGVGASLRSEDGYTEVHEVIPGGAADLHGRMKKGDQIIGVGQGTAGDDFEDIVDMRLNDVVKLIRGKAGTVVRLQVRPVDNPKETDVYVITRAKIKLTNQEARSQVVDWGQKPGGRPYRLGVIHLPSFYMDMDGARRGKPDFKSCSRDMRRLLNAFNDRGDIDAVVIDLRFNGGGSLQESVAMTGMFIDQGPVVQVKDPNGRTRPYPDPEPGMVWSGPVAVLTNMFSASASEIFAGAIQDYGRGVVIGDRSTHGKGTVQQLFNLGEELFRRNNAQNLGALKMTIQQFYRPGGDSTQNRGVVSDVEVPSLTGHLEGIAESELDYCLEFDRVRRLNHDRFGMMGPAMSAQLQALSAERVAQSEEFAEDNRRIELYKEQKDRKTVTLNLAKYLAEREELDTDKELEKTAEKQSDSDRPVIDLEEHYNQEALSIVTDYLGLLKEKKVAVAR